MGNHDHSLAPQASAEYAQEEDETFRAALQDGLLAKSKYTSMFGCRQS